MFCSHPTHGKKIKIDPFDLISGKNIKGSWGGGTKPDKDIPKFSNLFFKNKVSFKEIVSKKYKLNKINDAIEDLREGKVIRPLIAIDENLK